MAEMDDAYAVNVTKVAAFLADARVNQELMSTKDAVVHLDGMNRARSHRCITIRMRMRSCTF